MAGTVDDHSTDELQLLKDEYLFVLSLTGHSEPLAEDVLRAFFARGPVDREGRERYTVFTNWQADDYRGEQFTIGAIRSFGTLIPSAASPASSNSGIARYAGAARWCIQKHHRTNTRTMRRCGK